MSNNDMEKQFLETPQQRYKRYEKAKEEQNLWNDLLEDAYKYTIPDRNDWFDKTIGTNRMNDIFDSTAIDGVQDYASNIQSILTPAYTTWASIVAGDLINKTQTLTDNDKKEINQKLESDTEILFKHLHASNFLLKSNESLQDSAISTGVLLLNEGPSHDPLQFSSVPLSHVVMSEGKNGKLENFWRHYDIPIRLVPLKWPAIDLTNDLKSLLTNNPDQKVELIEGCIRYEQNNEEHQYYYYVQTIKGGVKDAFFKWREISPFIGFRGNVSPGEILGRGPALKVLPDIKVLNKLKEMILRGGALRAFPITLIESNAVINPHNLKIEAGDTITVDTSVSGKDPIRPMQVGGDAQFSQLVIADLQNTIKNAFMIDPLGSPQQTVNQTATQTEIRQQNWIKKSAAVFSRLTTEFLNEVLDKSIFLLRKKNILQDLEIAGQNVRLSLKDKSVEIEYASPILSVQKQEEAQRLEAHIQFIEQNFGSSGLAITYQLEKIPGYMADKMNVPLDLINDEIVIKQKLDELARQGQEAIQKAAQQGTAPFPAQQSQGEQVGLPISGG